MCWKSSPLLLVSGVWTPALQVLRQWLPPGKEYDFLCVNVRDRSVDLGNDCGLGAGAREP